MNLDAADTRARLESFLRAAAGADAVHIRHLYRLSGGAVQENWALDADMAGGTQPGPHQWVLRTDAAARVAASLGRSDEFHILQFAHAAGLHAPEPLWLCRDLAVTGREFFVMQRLPGIASGHRVTRDAALVPDRARLACELAENLARLHAIHPPQSKLAFLATMHARDNIAHYRQYLDQLADAHPALEWGLRWCEVHAPDREETTFIHRDYRTGNYLVDTGHLTGALDWEFAGWGDPREDIGWFTARCWRFGASEREAGGIARVDPFLDGYARVSGRRATRFDLDYWQVMAHLRWAVIALQQAQRHVAGGERSLELALTGRIVHELEYEILHLISQEAR